jgi:hypothetical protein
LTRGPDRFWCPSENNLAVQEEALAYAVSLVDAVCCVSASLTFVEDIQATSAPGGLAKWVAEQNTPALYDWILESFNFQGISNGVAEAYLRKHGSVTWRQVEASLAQGASCPRLANYWTYDKCAYDKTGGCCSEPEHRGDCPVPAHPLRNGRLNQSAYSLYFFIRDVARRDLVRWIDDQLSNEGTTTPNSGRSLQEALVIPMRQIFGVSDKVLTMTLSEVLMSAPRSWPMWFETGSHMIAIDTLVHNFLHRTGILRRFEAQHAYGAGCYRPGGCADILRLVSTRIDARRFDASNPANFPRLVQHALWRFCAIGELGCCNGVKIDDHLSCSSIYCILYSICGRIPLYK